MKPWLHTIGPHCTLKRIHDIFVCVTSLDMINTCVYSPICQRVQGMSAIPGLLPGLTLMWQGRRPLTTEIVTLKAGLGELATVAWGMALGVQPSLGIQAPESRLIPWVAPLCFRLHVFPWICCLFSPQVLLGEHTPSFFSFSFYVISDIQKRSTKNLKIPFTWIP